MDKLKQAAEAIALAKAIRDGAKASSAELTAEQLDKITAHLADADKLKAEHADEQKAADTLAALDNAIEQGTEPLPRRTAPAQPAAALTALTTSRLAVEDDPSKGYKTPRAFLLDTLETARTGRIVGNVHFFAAAGGDEQSTFADPYGGFLVPETLMPGFLEVPVIHDPMPNVTNVPMASATVKFNAAVDKDHSTSVSGGLTVSRRAEGDTSASSRLKTEQVTLTATGLYGIAYATEEILSDSPISFTALIESKFRDAFAGKLIEERLNGTNVGEFEGINNSDAMITIAKETGQAASTIVYENIIKMRARIWGYSAAVWYGNQDITPQLMVMNQTIGTGGVPVWQPSAREDHPDILFGRPLILGEYPNSIGTAGDLICANWTQYLEGTFEPLQGASSIHVRFLQHERAFKFWLRNSGACWWRTVLQPVRGSTLAPFVRLATRA